MKMLSVKNPDLGKLTNDARVFRAIAGASNNQMKSIMEDVLVIQDLQECIETRMAVMVSKVVSAMDYGNALEEGLGKTVETNAGSIKG
ncbi:hypothetical protein [Fundidesulfovibrio soli]|uniref:hypothetical protein n=1 Tax=Fundidesulfovibrio soli TaxID=2922716 RepID=UPI001FAF9A10|nr:hypothetical protein [Fundidesulfovibrio soli]